MTTRRLNKSEWKAYFDRVSKYLTNKQVSVKVTAPDLGAQDEVTSARMLGIAYDPNDDLIEVATEKVDHMIGEPTSIEVEEDGAMLKNIQITQRGDVHQIIGFKEPLALSAH